MGKTLLRGSNADIEEFSQFIRNYFDKHVPQHDDEGRLRHIDERLYLFVKELGGEISVTNEPSTFEKVGGSLTVYASKAFEIALSPITSPIRDNFTIVHELGHYFLHVNFEEDNLRFYDSDSDEFEKQAHRFALAFLMPEEIFRSVQRNFHDDLYEIASYFQVSVPVVEERIKTIQEPTQE